MPMDHVCEDLRTDQPFPSFTPSIPSSPFPQMAALFEDEGDTKFEESNTNQDPPAMPDPPLSDTQRKQALLMLREESPQEPILTDTTTLASTSPYPRAPGKVKVTGGSPGRSERGQEGPCQVCGERASGNFFGALVCLPCKSFFIRCTKDGGPVFLSQCQGRCNVSKQGRNRCQQCRYHKCQAAGMSRKEKPEAIEPGEGQILCRVCGDIANGIHFGVFTCEGCKKFFRRGLLEYQSYVCKGKATCTLNPRNRNNCRYCRYQKCLHVGMSRRAIKMGRPKKLNKDLEGALLTASRPHEMNSSSVYIPRISLDAMSRMEDQSSPSSGDTTGCDEDFNPGFLGVSSESNSSKRSENYEFLEAWTAYDNSRGVLPLKKEILRSVCSGEQDATLRAKWNVEKSNENDRSEEMYDQHCSTIVKSNRDGPHVGPDETHFNGHVLSEQGRDRRKQRRRRCKSDGPSLMNIASDEHPGLKRWKSDTDSPVSFFKYSATDFSENTSESKFELTHSSLFTKSGPLQSRDKPHQTDNPVNLSLLTCFERQWNDRSFRNPVATFPVRHQHKQHMSMGGFINDFHSLSRQRSHVPPLASYEGSQIHLNNKKTTRIETHLSLDDSVSSTKPVSEGTIDTEIIVPRTQRVQSCSSNDTTQSNASKTSVCKDEDTPKQTADGFLISKKNLEEIDHFFLSSMSLFIDIQKRIKASNQDTSISKERASSTRKQDVGSVSPTRTQSYSPGDQTVEIERLSPMLQPTPSHELICKDNGHTSATKRSSPSPPPRGNMPDTRPNQTPPDLSSSRGGHLPEGSGQLLSPKGHTSSPSGHISQPRTQASGNHLTSRNGLGNPRFLLPRDLKTAERLDSEYRFPAVRVCEYWNRVASSSQGVQMSIQEHRVLQDMLEAYMEMLKNLDESHLPSDPNITNLLDWPREGSSTLMEHVVSRIVRQVKEELAFMVKVPGFNDFHPDDRIFIIQNICFANVTLMATRDWYDPGTRTFRNMMNWKLPEFHPMYSYRLNAMDLGDQITLLRMDRTEAAMLSALNVTSADISGLHEPEVIEKSREFLMSALAAHISYKGLDPEKRMKELFNLMPIFRLCGFWTKSLREQIALNRQPNV